MHQRQSIRLKHYDYASAGYYFIAICCFQRLSLFGHIEQGQMFLNEYGKIAQQEWLNTINKRQNVKLNAFIIMPNHMHGIIHFTQNLNPNPTPNDFHSPRNNLGAIVRGYKSAVTSQLKEKIGHNVWQRNYYEHIIRDEKSYQMIAEYTLNNPLTWQQDCFYTQ